MSNIRGSQWGCKIDLPFQSDKKRRRYRCEHGRRKNACRECGGFELAARWMCYSARSRAKRYGLPCTITPQNVIDMMGDGYCPVLGIKYEFSAKCGKGGSSTSPSLDRFKPELGYVPGNCFVISNLANRIKYSASSDQVMHVALWMKNIESRLESQHV